RRPTRTERYVIGKRCYNFAYFCNMKVSRLITCVALFFLSCQQKQTADHAKLNTDTSYFDPNYEYIHLIPDSLRSEKQNNILDTLQSIVAKNMMIENGHLVFKLTREEFVKKGVPGQYYDLIQKDLVQNNNYLDTANLQQSIEEILDESFKEFER